MELQANRCKRVSPEPEKELKKIKMRAVELSYSIPQIKVELLNLQHQMNYGEQADTLDLKP